MTKDKLIELAQVGMGINSPNSPEYIVCEALIKALAQTEPWEKFCDSNCVWTDHHPDCKLAEQEPVAWMFTDAEGTEFFEQREDWEGKWTPLYTTSSQRPSRSDIKPLTDEEIRKANHHMVDGAYDYSFKQGVKWAEYKHGIKGQA